MNLLQILKDSINTIYVKYIGNDEIENINSKNSKVDKYANLQIIDLSNSQISLSVDTEPV